MRFRVSGSGFAALLASVAVLLLLPLTACSRGSEAGTEAFNNEDYDHAMDLWMPLAEDGDPEAQFGVAYLYEHGLGVPADPEAAIHWYRLAAEQGHASSQLNLGTLYISDHAGVPQDPGRAADWMRMAAEQGNAKAQYYLARMYYRGNGLPRNYELSAEWAAKAAEQGEPQALNHLGMLYSRGLGVEGDLEKGYELIRRAAEAGNTSAQLNLATKYIRGTGTEQDFVEALKWYTIFRRKAPDSVGIPMDWVENNMSEEQMTEAEQRAEQWIAEHGE